MFSFECIYLKKINSIHKCKPSYSVSYQWQKTKRLLKIHCSDIKGAKDQYAITNYNHNNHRHLQRLMGVGWEERKHLKPCRCFALRTVRGKLVTASLGKEKGLQELLKGMSLLGVSSRDSVKLNPSQLVAQERILLLKYLSTKKVIQRPYPEQGLHVKQLFL